MSQLSNKPSVSYVGDYHLTPINTVLNETDKMDADVFLNGCFWCGNPTGFPDSNTCGNCQRSERLDNE